MAPGFDASGSFITSTPGCGFATTVSVLREACIVCLFLQYALWLTLHATSSAADSGKSIPASQMNQSSAQDKGAGVVEPAVSERATAPKIRCDFENYVIMKT